MSQEEKDSKLLFKIIIIGDAGNFVSLTFKIY